MKKTFLFCAMFIGTLTTQAQGQDTFKPYQQTDLRLPSVPLIVSDPYFSVWSPYDKLNEGTTRHWTDDEKPIQGLLRVDGETYCFMGADRERYETIAPMANEEAWNARYSREKQPNGWELNDFNDATWKEGKAAFGSPDLSYVRTHWNDQNSDLYVRRTINIDAKDLNSDLALIYSHDDVFELYINGKKVANTGEIWTTNLRSC